MQHISFQAAARAASAKDPLSMIQRISQNFPSLAHTLVHLNVSKEFRSEVEYNQKILHQFGVAEGHSLLLINGVYTDAGTDTDVFSLLKVCVISSDWHQSHCLNISY